MRTYGHIRIELLHTVAVIVAKHNVPTDNCASSVTALGLREFGAGVSATEASMSDMAIYHQPSRYGVRLLELLQEQNAT